jgi:uncharacterized cupredoxin-like copper-binding protein
MKRYIQMTIATVLLSALATPVRASGGHDDHQHGAAERGHVSAVGEAARADTATKTIHVDMLDTMRFAYQEPLLIRGGETVRFVVTNRGRLNHEFSIGTAAEQQRHAAMMRAMPDMRHQDGNTLSLAPGATGEITWRFQGDPEVVFACNISGHSEAGMMDRLAVKQ